MTERLRVLVVDDSAFARKVIRETLAAEPSVELVGFATDGLEAIELIAQLRPDVVTLDLLMPALDGLDVIRTLRGLPHAPRVVVVTTEESDCARAIAALQEGAFDVVVKPVKLASDALYEIGRDLVAKVLAAGASRRDVPPAHVAESLPLAGSATPTRLVAVGASTGGPRAVSDLLHALPPTFPVPIAVVVHMPVGYTASFAERLDRMLPFHVVEARDAMTIGPGTVAIARAGEHLLVRSDEGGGVVLSLSHEPVAELHRPSVDVLFTSAAEAFGEHVVAVVLTGMGSDGLAGARAIRARGGRILAETEATAVVYGMPRVVIEAGLATNTASLDKMAGALRALVTRP